ncbi:MAG: LTA synthase family protein [Ruminococcus sp.]|nr:LTA synthase family protein [Ruminococcus sp.]
MSFSEVVMKKKTINILKRFLYNNALFLVFIFTSLVNAFLLRCFTVKNYASISPVLADTTIILLIGSIGYAIKSPKKRFFYYLPWSAVFTFLCIANSIYYTNYRSFISISLLSTASQLGGVMDAVTENILELKDLIFLWGIIALVVVYILLVKREGYFDNVMERQIRKRSVFGTLMTALACLLLFATNLTATDLSRLTKRWNREYTLSKYGLYTYQISDMVSTISAKLNVLFGYEENRELFEDFFEDKIEEEQKAPVKSNDYTDIFKGKNVIAIHAESIQQFCLDTSFNGVELTPNLNKLASEGIYFTNFYAQESVGTSSDTEFTFASSLMPASSGTVAIDYWDREYVTTQKLLKDLGYYTFSMHANNGTYWNRLKLHASFGYDKFFYYDTDYVLDEMIGLGLSDKSFFRQSIDKIKNIYKTNDKFYGTMIMLTNHTPFTDIENGHSDYKVTFDYMKFNEETGEYELVSEPFLENTKLGSYLKSVHYADEAIGQFIDELDKEGILEDTILVIYGDHDAKVKEEFYEYYYNHNPFTDETLEDGDDGYIPVDEFAYNINRKVPFIIWSKNKEYEPVKVDKVMGMYDCQPTLGNMLGFKNVYALGHDIFSFEEDEENIVIFPNGNFITDTVYYNSQKDSYFDLTDYENVAVNASCNMLFSNMKPEEIYADDYVNFKTEEDLIYNEDAFEERINNGVVDKEYITSRSEIAEERITISNAIIYYDMIRRIKEDGWELKDNSESMTAVHTTTAPVETTTPDSTTTTAPDDENSQSETDVKNEEKPVVVTKPTVTTKIPAA